MRYLLVILAFCNFSFAQQNALDSLKNVATSKPADSVLVRVLHKIVYEYYRTGDFRNALQFEMQAKEVAERLGNKETLGTIYNGLGLLYNSLDNQPQALQYHLKSLAIRTQAHDSADMVMSLCNIGIVYNHIKSYKQAMEYYRKALDLETRLGQTNLLDKIYNNIGVTYANLDHYETAGEYYFKALQLKETKGDSLGMATSMVLIADNYGRQNKYEMSLLWYKKSCALSEKLGDLYSLAINYNNAGVSLLDHKEYKQAEEFLLKADDVAKKNQYLLVIKDCSGNLSRLYEERGDAQKALKYYREFIAARDSIFNEENTRKLVQEEMNFDFEKKQAVLRSEQEKKDAVSQAEKRRQRIILFSISAFGLLVLVFAVFAYRSFLQKKKANEAIQQQKAIIEEKQKEILDSIHYARRIQASLMPSEKQIAKELARTARAANR